MPPPDPAILPPALHPSADDSAWSWLAELSGPKACVLDAYALLSFRGPDAATFLQGQVSADVVGLARKASVYASYNSPAGRVLATLLVWHAGDDPDDGFLALTAADSAAFVVKRLGMYVLRAKVTISDLTSTIACLGIGGPRFRSMLGFAFGEAPAPFTLARQGTLTLLGLPGPRAIVVVPATEREACLDVLAAHAEPGDADTWAWLGIRSGVPLITAATRDQFIPQSINWDLLGGINFRKGCYTGQEIIARTHYLGRLKERLFAFASETMTEAGQRLYSIEFGDQACGTVVNAARAPRIGNVLLATLQLAAAGNDVHLSTPDGPLLTPLALPYVVPAVPAGPSPHAARGSHEPQGRAQ